MSDTYSSHQSIGTRIKELRQDRSMTQQELADILHASKAAVSAYENDYRTPSVAVLILLADTFGVSTDYLLGRKSIDENKDKSYVSVKGLNSSKRKLVQNLVRELTPKF